MQASEAIIDYDEVIDALQHVFGIVGICPMVQLEDKGYEDLKAQVVVEYIDDAYADKHFTFKVDSRDVRISTIRSFPTRSTATSAR